MRLHRRGPGRSRFNSASKLGQGLVEITLVCGSDDVDGLSEETHDRRGRPALDNLVSDRLGLAEEVVGDRQAKEQLVGLLSIFLWLPGGELTELLQTLLFQLQKLAVVFFVDCLNAHNALTSGHDFGLRLRRLILCPGAGRPRGFL